MRRVIVEVHDLGARCDKVLALLRAKGFDFVFNAGAYGSLEGL